MVGPGSAGSNSFRHFGFRVQELAPSLKRESTRNPNIEAAQRNPKGVWFPVDYIEEVSKSRKFWHASSRMDSLTFA